MHPKLPNTLRPRPRRLRLGLLLLAWSTLGAPALPLRAQDAETAASPAAAVELDPNRPLEDDEVARVDGITITTQEFERYVGTVYARQPEGELGVQQELTERLIHAAAERAGVSTTDADVEDLARRLDERARIATGGTQGLLESLEAEASIVRESLQLLALQEKVLTAELGLAPGSHPTDEQLRAWIEAALVTAAPEQQPISSAVGVLYRKPSDAPSDPPTGAVLRTQLGRRVLTVLEPDERTGVLTELLGILLIRGKAHQLGVEFTPQVAAEEIARRESLVRARDADNAGLTYEQLVGQLHKMSMEEYVSTPGFGAEVLLRLMVERQFEEEQLRAIFDDQPAFWEERYGEGVVFEQALPGLWSMVRQRAYQQLFTESTIVRRF